MVRQEEPHYTIRLVGKHVDPAFQQLCAAVEFLTATQRNVDGVIEGYLETQFEQRVAELRREVGGALTQARMSAPLVYAEAKGVPKAPGSVLLYFKSADNFLQWAKKRLKYVDCSNFIFYKRRANKAMMRHIVETGRHYAQLGLQVGGDPPEYVHLELFKDICPGTVANFVKLLAGPLVGSKIHRVVKDGWIQGGDWVTGSGASSMTVDRGLLPDESFSLKHDRAGLLSMANNGCNQVGSQFFLTLKELPSLDGKYTVFGRVVMGMRVLHKIGRVPADNECPRVPVRIVEIQADMLNQSPKLRAEVEEERQQEAKEAAAEIDEASPEEQDKAATKLQSIYRGSKTRKEVRGGHLGDRASGGAGVVRASKVVTPPCAAAASLGLVGSQEEDLAAVKLQATYRGRKGRERVAAKRTQQTGQIVAATHDDLG